jgi:hypothetical protein
VNQVEYQASFWFPVTPPQLWTIVERFDLFESWWVWLADFTADDDGLVDGNVLRGTVIPPVPYRLRLTVQLQRCDRPRLVEAAIDGDLRGQASLQLKAVAGGTRADVAWSLRMRSAPLRVAAHVAYPLMRWGHDRIVDMAVAGFRERALPDMVAARPGSCPACHLTCSFPHGGMRGYGRPRRSGRLRRSGGLGRCGRQGGCRGWGRSGWVRGPVSAPAEWGRPAARVRRGRSRVVPVPGVRRSVTTVREPEPLYLPCCTRWANEPFCTGK